MASAAPLAGSFPQQREIRVDGADPDAAAAAPPSVVRVVSGAYFDTVGTKLLAGRTFQPTDLQTAPPVLIISESMARYYFKQRSDRPAFELEADQRPQRAITWTRPAEVVGIAADSRADGIDQKPMQTMYQADTQSGAVSTLLVRTAGTTDRLAPRIIETIPQPRSEPARGSRPDARGDPRRNDCAAAPQRHADRTVCPAGARDRDGRRRRHSRVFRDSADERARYPHGAWRRTVDDSAHDPRRRRRDGDRRPRRRRRGGRAAVRLLTGLLFGIEPIDPPTIGAAAGLLVLVALAASRFRPARHGGRSDDGAPKGVSADAI